MKNELEQKFYDTFGIEPKRECYYSDTHCKNHCNKDCVNFYMKPKYPEITDKILLELICSYFNNNAELGFVLNVKELKYKILDWAIYFIPHPNDELTREDFIKYVQSLFKGGE